MVEDHPAVSEWVSWSTAARMVGCSVASVEYYARAGRIVRRPLVQPGPTLSRSSVEEFAGWWAQRRARLTAPPRPSPSSPPAPRGWLSKADAARVLQATVDTVTRAADHGEITTAVRGRRTWVEKESLLAFAAREAAWVSVAEAADLTGCPPGAITAAAHAGGIRRRSSGTTSRPSLERASVERFAEQWWAAKRQREVLRQPRDARPTGPPPGTGMWLDTETTARVIGVSPSRVRQLARAGRLPATVRDKLWFRRQDIEVAAAARSFTRRARSERTQPA